MNICTDNSDIKEKIKLNLYKVPIDKLDEINNFIEFLIEKEHRTVFPSIIFKGIWKGIGFEKITNLEKEIRSIRKNSEELLNNRIEKWNI